MNFIPGWYLVRTETGGSNEGRRHCRHYVDQLRYDAQCIVEPNGAQILQWGTNDPANYKHAEWSPEFKLLANADSGDWWDNPKSSKGYNPDVPGDYSREKRKPTAKELAQRAGNVDPGCTDGLTCSKEIHVGIFFDGTNNNMYRDRPLKGHSNIASLFDAHREDRQERFRYYIPGVGTSFPQVGEKTESSSGKTFASGGEKRIHWAMLLVFNAVSRASVGEDLLSETEMTPLVTEYSGLKTAWHFSNAKMKSIFDDLQERLKTKVKNARPRVIRVNLSVFGFSRGAAEARTFCNWLQNVTKGVVGDAVLKIRFLGIFDTVASVGLADSSPASDGGFMDWADGTMEIGNVDRGVHYVAAHEIRRSFPLSSARGQQGGAVQGMSEYIYPGAHSDIGGGYSPGDQGKSVGGRSKLLSQIALNDMYFEAVNAGVELRRKDQMLDEKADYVVDPSLDAAFSAYTRWTTVEEKTEDVAAQGKAVVEDRMHYHMRLYWRWRASKKTDDAFKTMTSYRNASEQDKVDLWESELDWRNDIAKAQKAAQPSTRLVGSWVGVRQIQAQPNPDEIQKAIVTEVNAANNVPTDVDGFFDNYPHDSHAGFWLLGPLSQYDKNVFANEIRNKQEAYDTLTRRAEEAEARGDYEDSIDYYAQAQKYILNNFERRVLDANQGKADAASPATIPVMTDKDAADLRGNAGLATAIAMKLMGTGTRREANGHGQYRRIYDRSV